MNITWKLEDLTSEVRLQLGCCSVASVSLEINGENFGAMPVVAQYTDLYVYYRL
jgi:hypothetical protein